MSYWFFITALIAVFIWKMNISNVFTASIEDIALAIWPIILVIIAAVFTYNLSIHTGSMDIIN